MFAGKTFTKSVPCSHAVRISVGVYAFGALIVTVLYKVALSVRGQIYEHGYVTEKPKDIVEPTGQH